LRGGCNQMASAVEGLGQHRSSGIDQQVAHASETAGNAARELQAQSDLSFGTVSRRDCCKKRQNFAPALHPNSDCQPARCCPGTWLCTRTLAGQEGITVVSAVETSRERESATYEAWWNWEWS
jgi:hypothetical protein